MFSGLVGGQLVDGLRGVAVIRQGAPGAVTWWPRDVPLGVEVAVAQLGMLE